MGDEYKLREARIRVAPGVVLIAEVTSARSLKQLLTDLQAEDIVTAKIPKIVHKSKNDDEGDGKDTDNPLSRIAIRSGIPVQDLESSNTLVIKDGVPQLLRPGAFDAISDATLVLLYSLEVGLKINPVVFDSFKAVYEGQNIKTGSPLSMLLTNLRGAGYLDKGLYASGRKLRLTGKGEKKATEVLKQQCKIT